MRELIIKRSEWLHTKADLDAGVSVLHRALDNKKCCIGVYATSCGVSVEQITGVASFTKYSKLKRFAGELPEEMQWLVKEPQPGEQDYGFEGNTSDALALMGDNDNARLLDDEKEDRIARTFAKHGVNVTFVD